MLVTAEEMLHGLRDGELDVHQSAVGEHDDEEGEPAAGVAYCDRAKLSPVDLRTLPGSEVQFEVDGGLRLPDAADVVAQDGDAAAVSFLAQALEDLLRAIGVRIEQPCDAPFERVEEAAALRWAGPLEPGSCQPLGDGLAVKTERTGDLGDGQALTIPAVADPGVRLVVDHDRLRGQGGGVGGPRDMARMSWPIILEQLRSRCFTGGVAHALLDAVAGLVMFSGRCRVTITAGAQLRHPNLVRSPVPKRQQHKVHPRFLDLHAE